MRFSAASAALAGAISLMTDPAAAHAQSSTAADPVKGCAVRLVAYGAQPSSPEWSADLAAPGGGRLVYFGAEHSSDPAHPQFAAIEAAWREARPTVAFYEGPNRPVPESAEEVIRQTGESGYVRFLAGQGGVRLARLEPSPQAEVAALLERFTPEQVKLFFILRETARLRERRGMPEAELKTTVARMLEQTARMFPGAFDGTFADLDGLQAAYRRHWSEPAEWWMAPSRWFDPGKTSAETGGVFTNDVNRASSEFRDRHMYAELAQAARAGERVFAVVGRNHVAAQADALRCALR